MKAIDNSHRIRAAIMLVVYLMVLTASALHAHHDVQRDYVCQDCLSHVHHQGHLEEGSAMDLECVLCKFLHISYITPQAEALSAVTCAEIEKAGHVLTDVSGRTVELPSLRAPPVGIRLS